MWVGFWFQEKYESGACVLGFKAKSGNQGIRGRRLRTGFWFPGRFEAGDCGLGFGTLGDMKHEPVAWLLVPS